MKMSPAGSPENPAKKHLAGGKPPARKQHGMGPLTQELKEYCSGWTFPASIS
jgi:hypothetical protein